MKTQPSLKIYTLTFQFAKNYGAILQAYALIKYLNSLGHNAKIIDYWTKYAGKHRVLNSLKEINLKKILLFPSSLINELKFNHFKRKYLPTTERCNNKKDVENLALPDLIIVGSDQVWNSQLLGYYDDVYFLNLSVNAIKASYAASVGQDNLSFDELERLKDYLSNFDYISVREYDLKNKLSAIGIKNVVHSIDPVFLLSKEDYKKIAHIKKKEKYILTYYTDKEGLTDKLAVRLSDRYGGIPIYKIGTHAIKKRIKGIPNPTIGDYLGLIMNAEFIVTSSFHGTAFSIIFRKNFYSINAGNRSSRLLSLLESVGLMNRYISNINDVENTELTSIDYSQCENNLISEIEKGKKYIDEITEAALLRKKQK